MKTPNQKQVWNNIASDWQEFRKEPIKEVLDFLKDKEGNVLDLGSGSGRHLTKIKNGKMYLIDFSKEMISQANKKIIKSKINAEAKVSNSTSLPFEDNFFNSAIYINALHCTPSETNRENSLKELLRVLKPKSQALISVWSRNSKRIKNKPKEALIPWTANNKKYLRYYYLYDKDELENLLKNVGFKIIKSWENENMFFVVKKP